MSASLTSLALETPSDEVFIAAADRFGKLAHRENVTADHPVPYLKSSTSIQSNLSQMESREARLSLNYAFSCLRYQKHLEELLIESGFLHGAPLPDELNSLVLVMLWEFVERKFISRGSRSKSQLGDRIEEVLEVETNLEKYAIKLAACLARMRIRESALTLGDTLSDELKSQEKIRATVPVYGWINLHMERAELVKKQLEAIEVDFDLCDGLQSGLLQFDSEFLHALELSDIVKSGRLIIVDSTVPIGPLTVANLLNGGEHCDVLHAGGTLSSVPLLAHQVRAAGKRLDEEAERQKYLYGTSDELDQKRPKLIVCLPKRKHDEFRDYLTKLNVGENLVELVAPLSTLESNDPRLKEVKLCLIEPKCSLSATADPLQFLLMEGIEEEDSRLSALAAGKPQPQEGLKLLLLSSLKLPRSAGTVYLTRSSLGKENEEVVQYALQQLPAKSGFKLTPIPLKLPLDLAQKTYGNYLRVDTSESGSGLFMCTITQNTIQDPRDMARKAALKGLTKPTKRVPESSASGSLQQSSAIRLNKSRK